MAGTIDAGELKLTLKLMRENFAAGMKAVDADLKKLGATSEGAGKKGSSALGGLEKSLAGVGTQLMVMAGSYIGVQQLVAAFVDFGKQETAINRVVASMQAMGISTTWIREELDSLSTTFIKLGQREDAAWSGYQRLVQATGNARKAQSLLNDALKFAVAQGEDAGGVAEALARAYSGNARSLQMLLTAHGAAGREAKNFSEVLKQVRDLGEGANTVISKQSQAVNDLAAAFDSLKDSLGKSLSGPLIEVINTLSTLAQAIADTPENLRKLRDYLSGEDERRSAWQTAVTTFGSGGSGYSGAEWDKIKREIDARRGKPDKEPTPFQRDRTGAAPAPKPIGNWFDAMTKEGEEANEQYLKDVQAKLKALNEAWLESTRTWREGIDQTADSLGYLLIDLPTQGKDAWRSFVDSMLGMLRELAAEFISTTLKAQGLAWLRGIFPTGGAGGGTGGGRGGDSTIQGIGGPRPIGPGMGGGMQPVYVTVKGDLTRYAEFKIVSAGLRQGRQAGF